jgi:uncharacterized protein (TIGR02186 family)
MIRAPAIGLALLAALCASPARAQPLVTDISDHLVAITSSYTGTELLVFGALDRGDGDIVVIVRGPAERMTVRRKDRIFGVWANFDALTFRAVPSFYAVASNRPVEGIAPARTLARLQIGPANLRLANVAAVDDATAKPYREALIRLKTARGLYQEKSGQVAFLGNQLFRTHVKLPSNVPIGTYTAEVFLFRDGGVVAAQTTPLFVNKLGFERAVFDWAHRHAPLYGLAAVLIALFAGWIAAAAFRKA